MKIISIVLLLLGTIVIAGSLAYTKIEFAPFSITCRYWYRGVGFVFFVIGLTMMRFGEYRIGRDEGFKDGADYVIKFIEDNKINNNGNN